MTPRGAGCRRRRGSEKEAESRFEVTVNHPGRHPGDNSKMVLEPHVLGLRAPCFSMEAHPRSGPGIRKCPLSHGLLGLEM